ncbi:UDP-glucose 4-epimerase GalE [Paenibacillus tepidiphilus]|uniref:UDP-glucose 4-epimerase GalE n=1 Tax=Paenibacillus tepidiphilus TaxID=2608683 RepID=UPI0012389DD6|nr:UDP-glucose 4-epimerase GalE [Paenibacillus tepidiphilus]
MRVLVTGGAGYIGSHTCVELINANFEVIVIDNLYNSSKVALDRVEKITGKKIEFYQIDLLCESDLEELFKKRKIESVIHFAGYKSVSESVENPLMYYTNNLSGTLVLLKVMNKFNVKKLVFSSSATVYTPAMGALDEEADLKATNPYGQTKLIIEQILRDLYISDNTWNISILRYFNPIGAHKSGEIGEDPDGIPNNLLPYITQVAVGKLEELKIYGNDYPTKDGTGVRDFIHVVDVARGHIKAIEYIDSSSGVSIFNLGTGRGYSVMELVSVFEEETKAKINYRVVDRRPGDTAICYSNPSKAEVELNWRAMKSIEEMCEDAWRWQLKNPNGYKVRKSEIWES